jgi:predicted small integral membrane protein
VRYLINEALLRLIKPAIALLLGMLLYWVLTGPMGEPGSALLALACWIGAGVLIQLLETGVI